MTMSETRKPTSESQKAAMRKYYRNHRDKVLAQQKEYRQQNLPKIQERQRKYYERNRETILGKKHQKKIDYVVAQLKFIAEYKNNKIVEKDYQI